MINVDDKALTYAKTNGYCFMVYSIPITLACWDGSSTQARSLKVKAVYENEVEGYLFKEFEVSGVKVFISTDLKMDKEIQILQHIHMPFTKHTFGVRGVRIS